MRRLTIRLPDADLSALQYRAAADRVSVSYCARHLIRQGLDQESLGRAQGDLAEALDSVLRPHVSRLAALAVRAAVSAGTCEWLSVALAAAQPNLDWRSIHAKAKSRAVAQLRTRSRDEEDEEDES